MEIRHHKTFAQWVAICIPSLHRPLEIPCWPPLTKTSENARTCLRSAESRNAPSRSVRNILASWTHCWQEMATRPGRQCNATLKAFALTLSKSLAPSKGLSRKDAVVHFSYGDGASPTFGLVFILASNVFCGDSSGERKFPAPLPPDSVRLYGGLA